MRILVYPHSLAIGGSQINAIDLAARVAKAGHEVVVYGVPPARLGSQSLVQYIGDRGLRFIPARRLRYRPAPSRIAQLLFVAVRERVDLIHAYEWPPCLDAYYGANLVGRVPLVCTVLGMVVMPYVPTSVPLIMGTAELAEQARAVHRSDVWALEPPIDIERDHPSIDGRTFRREHGIADDEFLIVTVSRLAVDLKLDALVRAIDAVELLASRYPVRLLIVGGGPAEEALRRRADTVNLRNQREVVTLVGPMLDEIGRTDKGPGIAYAAADVVVGMGSSALRAASIGRAVVVQGEDAFSEVFEPTTLDTFLRQGFYGLGSKAEGVTRLAQQIEVLLVTPDRRRALGEFGRTIVSERFSLDRAVKVQLDIYEQVLRRNPVRSFPDALRSAYRALMLEIQNHNPLQKDRERKRERELLAAAGHGQWPPTQLA